MLSPRYYSYSYTYTVTEVCQSFATVHGLLFFRKTRHPGTMVETRLLDTSSD